MKTHGSNFLFKSAYSRHVTPLQRKLNEAPCRTSKERHQCYECLSLELQEVDMGSLNLSAPKLQRSVTEATSAYLRSCKQTVHALQRTTDGAANSWAVMLQAKVGGVRRGGARMLHAIGGIAPSRGSQCYELDFGAGAGMLHHRLHVIMGSKSCTRSRAG